MKTFAYTIELIVLLLLVGCASGISQSKLSSAVDSMNSRSTTLQTTEQKVKIMQHVQDIKNSIHKPIKSTE